MYSVVGCSDCESLWIVEDRPETTRCPSCRTSHRFDVLRTLAETAEIETARDARARLLAERSGAATETTDIPGSGTPDADVMDAGPGDEAYLSGSGVDPDRVESALESSQGGSQPDREVVKTAVRSAEPATEENVIEYARERDVPASKARRLLEKLVRSGAVSRTDDTYRVL